MDQMRNRDDHLDALLRAYHEACPTPEPGPNFMPQLWQRIESRQTFAFSFRRMANALVTAAMAASVALGVYMMLPRNPIYYSTYLETLAEANTIETPDIVAPVHLNLSDAQ